MSGDGVLAVIPARGGSKGIPRKNIRPFAGHPLLAYSVAAARAAGLVDRVIVSTDDEEIAAVGREFGAEVPFLRPAELATDDARDLPLFRHALDWLAEDEGYRPGLVVQLRPTSPLRPVGCVDRAVDALAGDPEADSVRAVSPPRQNPFKMWQVRDGYLEPLLGDLDRELFNEPRQTLPQAQWQTGIVDVIRTRTITELGSMTGRRILPIVLDERFAVDLDDETQWSEAEDRLRSLWDQVTRPDAPDLSGVRMVVFDFDGVFTDNRVFVSEDGTEIVACSRADGMGIELLLASGVQAAVVTSEENPVAEMRCGKLKIPFHRSREKAAVLGRLIQEAGLGVAEVAYVGNDLNDLDAMRLVGVPVAVADARPEVRAAARLVLRGDGGRGAVRELCDLLLAAGSAR